MRYPRPRTVGFYSGSYVWLVIGISLLITITFLHFVSKEFKKDVAKMKSRYENAESYYGKSIILDKDTLEILDYRLGQFMLSDRNWINEDVVFRLADK